MAEMLLMALPKEEINRIFEEAEHQGDYTIGLYRAIYPDWDEWPDNQSVDGYPRVCRAMNNYIFEKAIAFDAKHHPDVMKGGMWMNNGFGSGDEGADVPMWKVRPAPVKIAA